MAASLAEYLDSTPERRARRDRMEAMIDEYEESQRHPWRRMADGDGIVRISGHVNPFTAVITHFDEPVEIHEDDVAWLLRIWDDGARLDYELWRASVFS